MEKFGIFFSSNTSEMTKDLVKQTLNVQSGLENDKYLGLPIMIGKDKHKEFKFIKDKVKVRINSWKGKLLSQARRAILIKSVAQSIPIYLMSNFLLPKGFIHEINMLLAGF